MIQWNYPCPILLTYLRITSQFYIFAIFKISQKLRIIRSDNNPILERSEKKNNKKSFSLYIFGNFFYKNNVKPVNKFTLILSLVFGLQTCQLLEVIQSQIPKPDFSVTNLSIKEMNLTDMTLLLDTSVKNPYPVSLPTSKLGLDVMIEGMKLSHIDTDLGKIEAKSTKNLPMDIKLKYTDLLRFYKNFPTKEALALNLKGDLKLPIPAQYRITGDKEVSFPVDYKKNIPAIQPSLEVSNFSVQLPDFKKTATQAASSLLGSILGTSEKEEAPSIETSFDLKFTNASPAKFLMNNLKFDMDLDGNSFFSGAPKEIIQEENSNIVKIKTAMPVVEAGTALMRSFQSKTANYNLKGISGIVFPGIENKPVDFNYSKAGKLSWD